MSESDRSHAIILDKLANDTGEAGRLLRSLADHTDGHREVLAVVHDQPGAALSVLNHDLGLLGLSPKKAAAALDEIVGAVGDDPRAAELLGDHLQWDRLRELLVARGDLDAAAALVAPLDVVLAAVIADIASDNQTAHAWLEGRPLEEDEDPFDERHPRGALDGMSDDPTDLALPDVQLQAVVTSEDPDEWSGDEEDPSVTPHQPLEEDEGPFGEGPEAEARPPLVKLSALRTWARKLKERRDYAEFLQAKFGKHSIRAHLAIVLWSEVGRPKDLDEVTGDQFEALGMDALDGRADLASLLSQEELPSVDALELEEARRALSRRRRQNRKEAPSSVALARDKALAAAKKAGF